jgi:hypothetical protein
MPRIHQQDAQRFVLWCPACDTAHGIKFPVWSFDGNFEKPTITPSIKAWHPAVPAENIPEFICHSYVANGRIQFLTDCTHALRGQTVDLPEWPSAYS